MTLFMKNNGRILVLAMSVIGIMLFMYACSKDGETIYEFNPDEPQAVKAPIVTVIYSAKALGDRQSNDLIYKGVEQAAVQYGVDVRQFSPESYDEGMAYLRTMFNYVSSSKNDTPRQLYIVCATEYDEYIRENSHVFAENPNAELLYVNTSVPLEEGCGSTLYMPYYGVMYEAGALTSAVFNKEEVFIVGANPVDEAVKEAIDGYTDGFDSEYYEFEGDWLAERGYYVHYLGENSGEGYHIPDSTAAHLLVYPYQELSFYDVPVYVLVCGGSANKMNYLMDVLGEAYYVLGVDVDLHKTNSLLAAVRHLDRAMILCVGQWLSSDGLPHHQTLGLASGYTETVINLDYTLGAKDYFEILVSDELLRQIHADAVRKEEEYGR